MNYSTARTTLVGEFGSLASTNSWTVGYDNKQIDPPENAMWMSCAFVHNISRHMDIGVPSSRRKRLLGFMNININVPIDAGTLSSYQVAETIENHFDGKSFSGIIIQAVTITTVGKTDDVWWTTAVTIPFYTDKFI